jgi:hypothetical protein
MAAVPPATNPIPSSALTVVQERREKPDLAAAKYAPHEAVITMSVVTRAFTSWE